MKKLLALLCIGLFTVNAVWGMEGESEDVKKAREELKKITLNFDFSQNKDSAEKALLKINDKLYTNLLTYLYNKFPGNEKNQLLYPIVKQKTGGWIVSSETIIDDQKKLEELFLKDFKDQTNFDLKNKVSGAIKSLKDSLLINIYFNALKEQYNNSYIKFPNQKKTFKLIFNNSAEDAIKESKFLKSNINGKKTYDTVKQNAMTTISSYADEQAEKPEEKVIIIEEKKNAEESKTSEEAHAKTLDTFGAGLKHITEIK